MHLNTGLYILCCSAFLAMVSCLGGEDTIETIYPDDAEILTFSLSHDSISELAQTAFSIDQTNNLIYNYDSMAYLTDIYEPVIVNYTNSTGITNVLRVNENGDSIRWIASGDSLDFSQSVFLKVFSIRDTSKTKTYQVQLNIHQVDPDSLRYAQIKKKEPVLDGKQIKTIGFNGKYYLYVKENSSISTYQSEDIVNWQKMTVTGLPDDVAVSNIQSGESGIYACTENGDFYIAYDPGSWHKQDVGHPVKAVLGFKQEGQIHDAGLSLILEINGKNVFAFTSDLQQWNINEDLPDDFPLSGFTAIPDSIHGEPKLTLAGGISALGESNAVWATENGYYWSKRGALPDITGANVFLYDDEIYLLNGKAADGTYNTKIYFSQDGGSSWQEKPEKYRPDGNYTFRHDAAFVVDKNGKYFYIIGGQNETTVLTDIWQVFLNKKLFAK
ncbi:MAG: DUF6242 domain-containing protein [Candidatus Symbiothrix sp.]|jgi:hypothetical protein|nr:DUF6242 domain-containing protein [Candidatus Symbiothrix sp.]